MKKHIIGLMLFSFIVSAAAVVYAFFNISEIAQVYEVVSVSSPQYIPAERTHCKMRKAANYNSVEIRQAVLNAKTKQIDIDFSTAVSSDQLIDVNFFVKDERGTRYITTENLSAKLFRNGGFRYINKYDWLSNLNSSENLYVIAQLVSESENYKDDGDNFQPKFDAAKATAVTIDYGK